MVMGCYGIGVTRTAAAAIEQHHDANGIIWPLAIAPAHAHIVPVNWNDESLRTTAESLASKLEQAEIEVLLDDRDERPGVKFKDADLIGVPLRITVGSKSLARGCVEFKHRRDAQAGEIRVDEVVDRIKAIVRTELAK